MSLIETALHKLQHAGQDLSKTPVPSEQERSLDNASHRVNAASAPLDLPHDEQINLPRAALRTRDLLPPEHLEHSLTNQYRRIKSALISGALGHDAEIIPHGRSLVITSAMSGEGKTFTSLNLAMSLALEKDFNVLLVDGDVAKGDLSDALQIGDRAGLLDLVNQPERTIDSCILATDHPGLFVMPCGERRSSAPELLGSSRMQTLFADLLNRYHSCFIVFDSPPVLLAAEARSLLSIAGQVVVVVKAGESPKQSVLDALHVIGDSRPTSLILNQLQTDNDTNYGYHYAHETQRK